MSRLDDRYEFDWLPGFREMMACQGDETDGMEESQIDGDQPEGQRMNGSQTEESRMGGGWPERTRMSGSQTEENQMDGSPVQSQMLPPEQLQQEEQTNWNDFEYMIRMLPAAAREVWAVADAVLDRYEFEGSSMYAEYPDKTAVGKIVDMIYDKLKYYETEQMENKVDGTRGRNCYYIPPEERGIQTPFRHLILVIICWNMAYRRQRYRRRKKIFPLS